jgi:ATP-dependent RNA helicase DeaD
LPHLRLRFWQVDERARIDALTRVVEIEPGFDAGLIFVHHTNTATQLRDKLRARGYAAEHVASDTPPHQRMRIAEMLVGGAADMLVATDGAVWNAPVPRFTHLINFDIPVDIESCAHRLRHLDGAGHPGTVIFLVTAREMGMLHSIEQAAGRPIKALELPERLR